MEILATIYDNRNGILYDVSEAIYDISITTYLEDNAGKCVFSVIRIDGLAFWEGATISITIDGKGIFKGYIFAKERNEDIEQIKCTAYDQIRYLKNKDSKAFENKTSAQIFSELCDEFVLKYNIVDSSDYICAPRNEDNQYLYQMIKNALSDTLINTGEWFMIRDNFGVLEHINIKSLDTDLVLGDQSSVTGIDYKTSIDKDVYNQIKLYRDNTETGKHEVFIVNDTINGGQNLKEWGILQLYEKVDDNLNLAQIEQRARGMLSLYNNTSRELNFNDVIGDFKVCAGSLVTVNIADIGDLSIYKKLLVTECTHKIKNKEHLMDLTVRLVI